MTTHVLITTRDNKRLSMAVADNCSVFREVRKLREHGVDVTEYQIMEHADIRDFFLLRRWGWIVRPYRTIRSIARRLPFP